MTYRINSLTVVLENDIREDDAESLVNAILQMRGVSTVGKNISDISSYVSKMRVRKEIFDKLISVLQD